MAGKEARAAFQGDETESKVYAKCFLTGISNQENIKEMKTVEEAEGLRRGYDNGMMIGEFTANLRMEVSCVLLLLFL